MPEYRVYVLRLHSRAWGEEPKFRKANPGYQEGEPLVYVGSTGKTVDERLQDHLAGGRTSNRFVKNYFKRKMPKEYEGIRPRESRRAAEKREARKAEELRGRGWGVWQK
jgi:hypothetical protein